MATEKSNAMFVKIRMADGMITVNTAYKIRVKHKENGTIICAIPEFNIYFSARNMDDVDKKAQTFLDIFFGHYLENENRYSVRKLAVNLHRLGFKPYNNPSGMVNMIKNKPDKNTAFRVDAIELPKGFEMASSLERSASFAAQA